MSGRKTSASDHLRPPVPAVVRLQQCRPCLPHANCQWTVCAGCSRRRSSNADMTELHGTGTVLRLMNMARLSASAVRLELPPPPPPACNEDGASGPAHALVQSALAPLSAVVQCAPVRARPAIALFCHCPVPHWHYIHTALPRALHLCSRSRYSLPPQVGAPSSARGPVAAAGHRLHQHQQQGAKAAGRPAHQAAGGGAEAHYRRQQLYAETSQESSFLTGSTNAEEASALSSLSPSFDNFGSGEITSRTCSNSPYSSTVGGSSLYTSGGGGVAAAAGRQRRSNAVVPDACGSSSQRDSTVDSALSAAHSNRLADSLDDIIEAALQGPNVANSKSAASSPRTMTGGLNGDGRLSASCKSPEEPEFVSVARHKASGVGSVTLTLHYFPVRKRLRAAVLRADALLGHHKPELELAAYVRLSLVPVDVYNDMGKDKKQREKELAAAGLVSEQTRVVASKERSPTFGDELFFDNVSPADVNGANSKMLCIAAVAQSCKGLNKDHDIGTADFQLCDVPHLDDKKEVKLVEQLRPAYGKKLGKMHISLLLDKKTQCLSVTLNKVSDLPSFVFCGSPSPCVRITLIQGSRSQTKSSRTIKKSHHPVFGEGIMFLLGIQPADLARTKIILSVHDTNRTSAGDNVIGVSYLGKIASDKSERDQWKSCVSKAGRDIKAVHVLKPPAELPDDEDDEAVMEEERRIAKEAAEAAERERSAHRSAVADAAGKQRRLSLRFAGLAGLGRTKSTGGGDGSDDDGLWHFDESGL